jgi:hypothetical protein
MLLKEDIWIFVPALFFENFGYFVLTAPTVYIFIYVSVSIYKSCRFQNLQNPEHPAPLWIRKISASGARFCRQYECDCRIHPLWIQSGRERGCLGFFVHLFSLFDAIFFLNFSSYLCEAIKYQGFGLFTVTRRLNILIGPQNNQPETIVLVAFKSL